MRGEIVEETFKKQVEETLDKIRPNLQSDGGDVTLIEAKEGIVTVELTGACSGCPMANLTLKMGIEKLLIENVKDFKELKSV